MKLNKVINFCNDARKNNLMRNTQTFGLALTVAGIVTMVISDRKREACYSQEYILTNDDGIDAFKEYYSKAMEGK